MNAYQPSTKYQDDCDYSNTPNYTPRHSSAKNVVNKHTSTPYEFMICLRCQEKIAKRNPQYANYSVGDCDRNLNEYSKALNYINSCHTFINEMMNQGKISSDYIRMPDLPNFMDLFNTLSNSKTVCANSASRTRRTTHESRYASRQSQCDDRSRNSSNEANNRVTASKSCPNRQQNREELKQTSKGRFIDLLPNEKQDNYNKQDRFSPGTTESEESDLEANVGIQKASRIAMPLSKFKSKMKAAQEKVIYEEDSHEDDSPNMFQKKEIKIEKTIKEEKTSKKPLSPGPQERPRSVLSSPTAQRSKIVANTSVSISSPDSAKKTKQRSSSSVTPRERLKLAGGRKVVAEVAGNFSDTAITAGHIIGQQIGKRGSKTLCPPVDLRNTQISQQELDKYAKELLGSETPTPRSPRSKSPCRSSSTDKSKVEDRNKKFQKPFPSPTMKSQASEQKRRSSQEKQASTSNINVNAVPKPPAITNINTQQQKQEPQQVNNQQVKKFRKSYSTQLPTEPITPKKQILCRKSIPVPSNVNNNQNKMCNSYSYGGMSNQCCGNDNIFVRNRCDKGRMNKRKTAVEVQEHRNEHQEENEDIGEESSPEHMNLLCDNIETLSMHSRSGSQDRNIPKVQYSVTEKPRDFFTTNRKCARLHRKEYDIESDIKTDSDIEEDHFEKDEVSLSRKSSKHNEARVQMSEVLTRLGLFPSPQMPAETEQLINEAKSTRANDERNRPFREPRKITDEANEDIMKIDESRVDNIYSTESLTHLRRTISEESSDIKSDEEIYNNTNSSQKPYNFCIGNSRYQS